MTERYTIVPERPDNESAVRLTSEGFVQDVNPTFTKGVLGVLDHCTGFQTAKDSEDNTAGYVGYTMYGLESGRALYINTIMIDQGLQGRGLAGSLLNRAVAAEESVEYVTFKTQSARMYFAAKAIFKNVYPDMESGVMPDDVFLTGNEIAAIRGGTFPVHRGSYGAQPMYGMRPEVESHPEFYQFINFEQGDALFCVSKVSIKTL